MATEVPIVNATFVAGADLSAEANLYKFVKMNGTGREVVICTAVTDRPVGVLQNLPTENNAALVMMLGMSKINSNAALAAGNEIGTSADGQGAPYAYGTATTSYMCGIVVTPSGAADGRASAWINCINPARGA